MRFYFTLLLLAAAACGASPTKSELAGTFVGYTPAAGLFTVVTHPDTAEDNFTGTEKVIVLNSGPMSCSDSNFGINGSSDTSAIIAPFTLTFSGDPNSQSILDGNTPIAISSGDGVYSIGADGSSPNTEIGRGAVFALQHGNDPNDDLHFATTGSVTIAEQGASQLMVAYDVVLDDGTMLSGTTTVAYCALKSSDTVASTSKVVGISSGVSNIMMQRMRHYAVGRE